jgi:hypothetical protein
MEVACATSIMNQNVRFNLKVMVTTSCFRTSRE